ncbi:MAG: thioesterase family protein [Sphingobacteriales bacterium]|nr:thioesterase family protein [Sphingobacteriales bacterium]MBI3718770.1 thioesterase family protein [Sphingobacteriales bacterium]
MARIKIDLPEKLLFTVSIPVRITDINYGGHVGNDAILSIIHEARVKYLAHFGYTELNISGIGLIMSDAGIEYKGESFYGDELTVSVTAAEFSKISFELYYKIESVREGKNILIAKAKTGMVCYDYDVKKVAAVPEEFVKKASLI